MKRMAGLKIGIKTMADLKVGMIIREKFFSDSHLILLLMGRVFNIIGFL